MSWKIPSKSQENSASLARELAGILKPGHVVFLMGELGTGKTFFVRHAAGALGVHESVTSPSFTMAQTYSGTVTVHHLDLYRLSKFGAEDALDFDPFFESDAITFVEWPEAAVPFLQTPDLIIRMEHVDMNSRQITIECLRPAMNDDLEKLLGDTGA